MSEKYRSGKSALLAVVTAVALSTAAHAQKPTKAQNETDAKRAVTCAGAEDCAIKWGKTLRWVLDTSYYKIDLQTDSLIQTQKSIRNFSYLSMTVNKIPVGNDTYEFELRGDCDNMFGCHPTLTEAKADLVRTVMDGKVSAAR